MPDARKPLNSRETANTGDESILEELRGNYDFDTAAFADIREQGSIDIKFIANDPWPDKEKQLRRENDRPLLSIDQLNQYTNQVINEIRQHPREIKISPAGYGATAALAELRENRVRAIQYKSDAQAAYVTAMENVCQRSYGFARVSLRYISDNSFDQEIVIKRIPNPDAVLFDAGCKELDCSDAEHCFVLDQIPIKEFKRRWPDANITDFQGELARNYSQWIQDKFLQMAEYWRCEKTKDELIEFEGSAESGPLTELVSKLKKAGVRLEDSMVVFPAIDGHPEIRARITNTRDTKRKKIVQYITNGVEILEDHEWLGKWIPIVPIFGKELYVTEAGGSKRLLMSLIRNARDAQMGYNYAKTCQTEAVGMVPKTTYLAIEGQFEGHEDEVASANKVPKPYLYYKGFMPDVGNGAQVLPPPIREPFDPPIQNLEILSDSFRQAIQTSVGMYNSSVGRNDTNVKSGVAIKELDAQSDLGAFHFLDNYNRFITAIGRIVNDLQSKIEITPRQVPVRKKDGTEAMVWINKPYTDDQGQEQHHDMTLGEYDVTISVGPNADSQRDQASDFIETFIEELPNMQIDPGKKEALLALCIKIKQMGPIADQMVDILQPQPGDPGQLQAQLQQLQQQLQELEQENAALHQDRAAKVLEQQTKVQIENMKLEGKAAGQAADHASQVTLAQLQNDIKVLVALIQAKNQQTEQEQEMFKTFWIENHKAAHEVGLQAVDHAHEAEMAQHATAAQMEAQAQSTEPSQS